MAGSNYKFKRDPFVQTSTGSGATYGVTVSGGYGYVGQRLQFKSNHASTGSSNIYFNGSSIGYPIKKNNDQNIAAGDIESGQIVDIQFDGTNWQMLNASGDTTVSTAQIEDAAVTSAKIDPTVIQTAQVTVTNSELKELRATPKTLVAAPGAGYFVRFIGATLQLNAGTNALTETADNLDIRIDTTTVSAAIETTGFIDQTTDQIYPVARATDAVIAKSAIENKALVLKNTGDGEFGGNAANDATLLVNVQYQVLAVPA